MGEWLGFPPVEKKKFVSRATFANPVNIRISLHNVPAGMERTQS